MLAVFMGNRTDGDMSKGVVKEPDWREELGRFRKVITPPQPCNNPRYCDSYQCDVNRGIIEAFERVDQLLAAESTMEPMPGDRVEYRNHESMGIGVVESIRKSAMVKWDYGPSNGPYGVDHLRIVEKKEKR